MGRCEIGMTFLCFQVTGSGKVVYVLLLDYTTSKFAKVRFKLYYPHNRSVIPTTERCSSAPHCARCQMWPHVVSSLGDKLGVLETTCTELVLCSTRTTSSYRQWFLWWKISIQKVCLHMYMIFMACNVFYEAFITIYNFPTWRPFLCDRLFTSIWNIVICTALEYLLPTHTTLHTSEHTTLSTYSARQPFIIVYGISNLGRKH